MNHPVPGRHLLAASTGGHLAELLKWSQLIDSDPESLWVTFDSPQSRSLLRNRRVLYVPYVAPRDWRGTTSAFVKTMRVIDWEEESFQAAISTGAAVGLAALVAARLHRVPAFYFESVCRVDGPSLTGRLASLDPWIHTHCQYPHWPSRRWLHRGSLFEAYETIAKSSTESPRLFVTLGTIRPYRFDALVDAVLSTGLADSRTVWQLGATARRSLPGTAVSQLGASEFDDCVRSAEVVITHAGVGTLMGLLEMGMFPVVVPRRADRNEHVDDHQVQIARLLKNLAISNVSEADELTADTVVSATASSIRLRR